MNVFGSEELLGNQLCKITKPSDIKKMNYSQLDELCGEIRELLIDRVSSNGGHLSSNLGVVELTVALHRVFDCPNDQIVWDVGHQTYAHKILTERLDKFETLRKENGISGFSKPSESKYDAFISGHAGISVSAAYGLAVAKKLNNDDGYVVSVTGDGAMSNGIIYEGINNSGRSNAKLIIVLNDNEMSISKNVGALAKHLTAIRLSNGYFKTKDFISSNLSKVPIVGVKVKDKISAAKTAIKQYIYHSNIFEDFGFTYLGPVNGHDIESLCDVLNRAKTLNKPVVVHVETQKGIGYEFAKTNPTKYHGVSHFDKKVGIVSGKTENFSSVFGEELTSIALKDKRVCAVTAAMCDGTGLNKFSDNFKSKNRFFDVGIAESHAVTFCGGLATNGLVPVFAVYSTFLQRCYDQLIHDISIEKLHIVLAIDRAGIVGDDGETHQGIFDVPMLKNIPNVKVYSPCDYNDLKICLNDAINDDGLVAVRYPRGKEEILPAEYKSQGSNFSIVESNAKKCLIITYGRLWNEAYRAAEKLKLENIEISALKLTRILPIAPSLIDNIMKYENVLFYEETISMGGIGESIAAMLIEKGYKGNYKTRGITQFVPQATFERALEKLKLNSDAIIEDVLKIYNDKK
ncbi:MAG: 1-deoxy-D-xylulose-5-phosphate synthase [Oscillospiraceae bacterium]